MLDAYVEKDANLALAAWRRDEEIDDLWRAIEFAIEAGAVKREDVGERPPPEAPSAKKPAKAAPKKTVVAAPAKKPAAPKKKVSKRSKS